MTTLLLLFTTLMLFLNLVTPSQRIPQADDLRLLRLRVSVLEQRIAVAEVRVKVANLQSENDALLAELLGL